MTRFSALLAAALLVAAGACGEDRSESPEPAGTATLEPTPTKAATSIDVEVREGKVVGGMKRVKVPLDNEVRLSVRSDVADEVHVHEFDKKEDIAKGGGVLITFVADVPGVFVIELEQLGLHIVELEVRDAT